MLREYFRVKEEVELVRKKFIKSMSGKRDEAARSYSATLKDYRSIQVKFLQTLAHLGVKNPEDDLAKLLSNLPEIVCDIPDCKCKYHASIKSIAEVSNDNEQDS